MNRRLLLDGGKYVKGIGRRQRVQKSRCTMQLASPCDQAVAIEKSRKALAQLVRNSNSKGRF